MGVHYLAVMDMTGLLTPRYATMMVSELREYLTNMPLHIMFLGSHRPPRLW